MIRLSSLGDVILSTAALSSKSASESVDWLVGSEYVSLLEGHPAISRIHAFDRKSGTGQWISLCNRLADSDYDLVVDLHRSLRTRVLKWIFILRKGHAAFCQVNKQRLNYIGYFVFKKHWPKNLRPTPFFQRAQQVWKSEQGDAGRPDFRHLLNPQDPVPQLDGQNDYYCVMPSAKWSFKEWALERFIVSIQSTSGMPVVLGTPTDQASLKLVQALREASIPHINLVGAYSFRQIAQVLAKAQYFLGNDTGLAHLAESVGTPARVFFGPTVPDMGYGPIDSRSHSFGASLLCRPCGKDGRYCHRVFRRYQCLKAPIPNWVSTR